MRIRTAVALAATVGIVWVLVRRFGGGSEFAGVLVRARVSWVAIAVLLSCACALLGAERWRLVVDAMGYKLRFRRSLEVVLATWPLAMVTPSRSSDLLRPLGVRGEIPLPAGTGSVLAEKAIDLLVLLLFAAGGAAVQGLWTWTACIGAVSLAEIVAITLIVIHRSWLARLPFLQRRRQAIEDLFRALDDLRHAPVKLLGVVLASLLMRFLTIGITHTLLLSVGARVQLADTVSLWPVATLVGLAPLTLAGIGTRDATFIHLLAVRGAHADPAQVLAATVGYTAVAIGLFAIVGLPFMVREALRESHPTERTGR